MGLKFNDLASWRSWQDSRRRLHVLKDRLTPQGVSKSTAPPPMRFWIRGTDPRLLVACDSNSPTNYHSLLAPLNADADLPVLVAAPADVELGLPDGPWGELGQLSDLLTGVRTVATIGDHLRVGAWAHAEARIRGWHEVVVQHGLLTPFAPPPPRGVEWLAWSQGDAHFIAEGRPDLQTHVVGSAMLAAAAEHPAPHVSRFETPVFLGQLHGAELSRWAMTRSVIDFWRRTGAIYRPHPREEDRLSRAQHALWRRMGMEFDTSSSLGTLARPVVSAFSTGVLEAAARGVPAWVYHLDPPRWLEEVWDRYGMRRWGEPPTTSADWAGSPSAVLKAMTDSGAAL